MLARSSPASFPQEPSQNTAPTAYTFPTCSPSHRLNKQTQQKGGSENGQAGEPQPGGRDREDISGAAGGAEGTTNERDPSPSAVEASSPDGGWAEILAPVRPAARGANGGDDGINADKTLDEECLSDDDVYRGSRFNFTPAGEAAHAVDTAAGVVASDGGYARGVGLRRRGEGARWDSAALGTGRRGLPKRYGRGVGGGNAAGNGRDSHVWTRLTNPAEMEYYRFAVAADPGEWGCCCPLDENAVGDCHHIFAHGCLATLLISKFLNCFGFTKQTTACKLVKAPGEYNLQPHPEDSFYQSCSLVCISSLKQQPDNVLSSTRSRGKCYPSCGF